MTRTASLTDARATLAMRQEEHRIARKHWHEAASRTASGQNVEAYRRAEAWMFRCLERERQARVELLNLTIPNGRVKVGA